jgi:hypothetical protein
MGRTVDGSVGSEEDRLDMKVIALTTNPSTFVQHNCTVVSYWTVVVSYCRNVRYYSYYCYLCTEYYLLQEVYNTGSLTEA